MNDIRKACVRAVFDEFDDLDVTGLVDLIIDTINKEL